MTSVAPPRFMDATTPPHILTLVLMAGAAAANMATFLPALPAMTEYFGTTYGVMQLSVSLYLAVTAIIQLFVGPISDRYGRRPVTLIALVIFMLATLGCLMAPTAEVFLIFRMIQGAVVVGIVLSRAIVRDMFEQDEAASMIGYVTMGMAFVPMIAPMIGGALDEAFGWRGPFWFLLAIGAAVFALCWRDQGETAPGEGKSFSEQFADTPELFASRRFWGYVATSALASGAFFAFLGGAPLVASNVFGLSSFWSGAGFGAPAIGYALGNYISGRYSAERGVNTMIRTGCIIATSGLSVATVLVMSGYDSALMFFAFCTFVGLGNGMVIPNASAGMLSVRPHLAGTASGVGGAFMIGGGAALSVLGGWALQGANSSLPLLLIMTASVALGLVAILYVIRRERRVAGQA